MNRNQLLEKLEELFDLHQECNVSTFVKVTKNKNTMFKGQIADVMHWFDYVGWDAVGDDMVMLSIEKIENEKEEVA